MTSSAVSKTYRAAPSFPGLAPLARRDFRLYFGGQALSMVGSFMQALVLGWVIAGATQSNTAVALVEVAGAVPVVLLSLLAGAFADRADRRRVLFVTQTCLAAVAMLYGGLYAAGWLHIPELAVLAALTGALNVCDIPARHALVGEIVPTREVSQAMALTSILVQAGRLLGPGLAAALVTMTSPAFAFVANGLSYFALVIALTRMGPLRPRAPRAHGDVAAIRAGLSFAWRERRVRAPIAFTGLANLLVFPFLLVFQPMAVKTIFGGDQSALAAIMSAVGLGALLGATAVIHVPRSIRSRTLAASGVVAGVAVFMTPVAQNATTGALLVGLASLAGFLAIGLATTFMHDAVPDELRGRVVSVNSLMYTAVMPASALVLGFLADATGLRVAMALSGAAFALLAPTWLLVHPNDTPGS